MAPPVHTYHPPSHPAPGGPDTDAAAAISQLFHAGGPGTTVFLVPRTLYTFYSSVDMAHPGTTIATLGFPSFDSGDQAVVETRADNESVAVRMINLDRTAVKRIHFRGCRGWGPKAPSDDEKERWKREGRMGWLEGGGPLVVMGGPQAQEQILEGCRLEDPRGWTGVRLLSLPPLLQSSYSQLAGLTPRSRTAGPPRRLCSTVSSRRQHRRAVRAASSWTLGRRPEHRRQGLDRRAFPLSSLSSLAPKLTYIFCS